MDDHESTIHGTTASLFRKAAGFRSTTGYRELNLFVTEWHPGPLTLVGLRTKPKSAILRLGQGRTSRLPVTTHEGVHSVVLPATAPGTLLPVVTVRFAGQPEASAT